jgi:hypothetical protein
MEAGYHFCIISQPTQAAPAKGPAMQANLLTRLSRRNKLALAGLGLIICALLFLWLALPRIVQSQAQAFVAEKTGHRLSVERPEFNPFTLALRIGKLELSDPAGKPLFAFDGLLVDVSAASLPRMALVFDAIRLDGPKVTLVELPDGKLNWTPFLDALKDKEDKPAGAPPRLDIRSFVLTGGALDFADRRATPGFATRIEPLDLTLDDISTLPDDQGRYQLAARTASGARLALQGELDLNPVAVAGDFRLDDFDLAQLAPYLRDLLPAPPAGKVALAANYRVGNGGDRLDLVIDKLTAKLTGLRLPVGKAPGAVMAIDAIELQDGSYAQARQQAGFAAIRLAGGKLELPGMGAAAPRFAALNLEDARLDLGQRQATLGRIVLNDGRVAATRDAQGRIDLLEALRQLAPAPAAKPAATGQPAAPAWRFRLAEFAASGLGLVLRDAGVSPAAELALDAIALRVADIGDDLNAALPLRLAFDVRSGGRFTGEGRIVPAGPALDFQFKLTDLALRPAQPYLASKTTLAIAGGKFFSQGRLAYDAKGPSFRGDFALRELRLAEADGNILLAWKNLASPELSLTPRQLDLGELRLSGLDTQLIIDKDKNINLKRAIRQQEDGAGKTAAAPAAAPGEAPSFVVNIDRLRFYNGEMDFADHSLMLPFGTRIHKLRGSIGNLSSQPGAPGQIELDGEVDDYGMARAVGQVDLFHPTDFMDLRVIFRNVEMTRLTPYTATFAGRKIDSGKLSLDLQYKIKQRQLQGENQVVMERLVLGERVESPTAKSLPLDLAIAILQDSDGRIDLGLPVAGSLDDPEFSYGQIVWKVIANVLTKIVTAPFRALGALFGGGEKIEDIAFEAGAAQLSPPEREKLARIAAALAKRPGLLLALGGQHAEADRLALQDVQLRRAVIVRMGQRVSERGDPGPLSTRQPKVQAALEALYGDRFGGADLAALKEGFRRANPGQLEESLTGKMMSRLSGLLREKKTLGEDEVARLKGADFHAVVYERLRAAETIADTRLQELAQARGEHAVEILKSQGVAAERLRPLAPEKTAGTEAGVALKLALEAAGKN